MKPLCVCVCMFGFLILCLALFLQVLLVCCMFWFHQGNAILLRILSLLLVLAWETKVCISRRCSNCSDY